MAENKLKKNRLLIPILLGCILISIVMYSTILANMIQNREQDVEKFRQENVLLKTRINFLEMNIWSLENDINDLDSLMNVQGTDEEQISYSE